MFLILTVASVIVMACPFKGSYISGSILGTLHIFIHLTLIITLGDRHTFLNLDFADERNGVTLSYSPKALKVASGRA